jgi:hypothetical protein
MRRAIAGIAVPLVVSLFIFCRPALAGEAPAIQYQTLSFNQDASVLKGAPPSDRWDPVSYIALNDSGDSYLSLGGEARVRWESWNNFGFAPANDDDFGLFRLRLHGDLHLTESFRVFVEGKSSLSTDRSLPGGRRTLDEDTADLQNAFIDVARPMGDTRLTLRGGRQELLFGKQRLVSPLDWSNTRRTWDGGDVIWTGAKGRLDAFVTQVVPVQKYEFNDTNSDDQFWGLYGTGTCPLTKLGADIYYLGLDRETGVYDSGSGHEVRHTVGLRLGGKIKDTNADVDLEGGYQFGSFGGADIEAFFVASQVGYTFPDLVAAPRVYLGFDYASGDDDPADGDLQTFNQLYPLAHAYLGYIDVVGRQNVMDFSQGLVAWPVSKKTLVKLENHILSRAETSDALYNAGGGIVRSGASGGSRELGDELDVTIKHQLDRHTAVWLGYSHFFAGDFIRESGSADDIDFAYATIQYTF